MWSEGLDPSCCSSDRPLFIDSFLESRPPPHTLCSQYENNHLSRKVGTLLRRTQKEKLPDFSPFCTLARLRTTLPITVPRQCRLNEVHASTKY